MKEEKKSFASLVGKLPAPRKSAQTTGALEGVLRVLHSDPAIKSLSPSSIRDVIKRVIP